MFAITVVRTYIHGVAVLHCTELQLRVGHHYIRTNIRVVDNSLMWCLLRLTLFIITYLEPEQDVIILVLLHAATFQLSEENCRMYLGSKV